MKFGLTHSFQTLDGSWTGLFERVLEQILLAEELGFDCAMVSEHHLVEENGYCPRPLTLCAAIAARTRRIRTGPGILQLPLYHPLAVAESAAVIDQISHGRLILGLGLGYREKEFAAFQVPLGERRSRFEESLRLLDRLFRERGVTHEGPHFPMRDATLTPRPVQSPRPPFWIAAKKKAAIERAARLGDGWYIDPVAPLQVVRRGLPHFRRALEEAGRSPERADVILRREAYLARGPRRAWEEAKEAILYNYREYLNWGHLMDEEGRPVPPGARSLEGLRTRFLVGTPEECIQEVEGYRRDLRATHLVLRMQFPGLSQDQVLNSIRLFGEEVLPHFSP